MKKISIGILTYNHEAFIKECLQSVFQSNYENLEIVISDDCSKDKTVEIIQTLIENYQGKHSVIFNYNERNLGLAGNFNKTFYELASGDFLVTLGGDDMINEDYFEDVVQYFVKDNNIMMVDVNGYFIDEASTILGVASKINFESQISELRNYLHLEPIYSFAPGRMIKKELIHSFKSISNNCPTEDSVLVLRSLLLGKHLRLNKKVILYRRHSQNISSTENLRKLSNASIIAQYLKDVIHLYNQKHIPEEQIGKLWDRINFEFHRREINFRLNKTLLQRITFKLRKFLFINT